MLHTSTKKRIYLSPPHLSGKEWKYIQAAIDSNWIAPLGPNVDAFEKDVAQYVGIKGAVAVSSGTAAIHLALLLLDVKKGDTVFCSTFTFVASANPILYQGAEPIFIDSEPDTWNMSPSALNKALKEAAKLGKLPKAVIVVNLYGQSAKMDELLVICNNYGVPIIEDAAESLGASFKGKASGTLGAFGIYSFNGNKIITTSGGGMLVSDNVVAIEKARFLATQSREPTLHYQHQMIGFNYRMSNILAGIGRAQMEVIEERVKAKRLVFQQYFEHLSPIAGIQFMPEMKNTMSNRWLTTITVDKSELGISPLDIINRLAWENIETRPVWKPLHLQPLFKGTKYYPHRDGESISEHIFKTGICLPSGTNLLEEELTRVIECLKNCIKQKV